MTVLETIKDQKKEEVARAFLQSHMDCIAVNMPQFCPVDCLLVNIQDGRTAGVEFKFRNIDHGTYPTIWLEESKQVALLECARVWDKAYFMPCFNGVLYRINVQQTLKFKTVMGGRNDRGIDDMDKVVEVPMFKLERVGKLW